MCTTNPHNTSQSNLLIRQFYIIVALSGDSILGDPSMPRMAASIRQKKHSSLTTNFFFFFLFPLGRLDTYRRTDYPYSILGFAMAEATTAELVNATNQLSLTVEAIQQRVAPLLQTPYNEVAGRLNATDRAKFQVTLAYTLNSLFWGKGQCTP